LWNNPLIGAGVMKGWLVVFIFMLWVLTCRGTELTFELPDRDRQCFYQEIEKGTECSLEYQVCNYMYWSTQYCIQQLGAFIWDQMSSMKTLSFIDYPFMGECNGVRL